MSTQSNHVYIHAGHDGLPSPELFHQSNGGLRYEIDRFGAIAGFVGAAAAFVLGTLLLAVRYFVASPTQALPFDRFGTVLLVSVIPLVLAGAAFLDRLEDDLEAAEARTERHVPEGLQCPT
jgi:hypothetical protein